jgi:hypothetical protein
VLASPLEIQAQAKVKEIAFSIAAAALVQDRVLEDRAEWV